VDSRPQASLTLVSPAISDTTDFPKARHLVPRGTGEAKS
jgi:hypothetical protein